MAGRAAPPGAAGKPVLSPAIPTRTAVRAAPGCAGRAVHRWQRAPRRRRTSILLRRCPISSAGVVAVWASASLPTDRPRECLRRTGSHKSGEGLRIAWLRLRKQARTRLRPIWRGACCPPFPASLPPRRLPQGRADRPASYYVTHQPRPPSCRKSDRLAPDLLASRPRHRLCRDHARQIFLPVAAQRGDCMEHVDAPDVLDRTSLECACGQQDRGSGLPPAHRAIDHAGPPGLSAQSEPELAIELPRRVAVDSAKSCQAGNQQGSAMLPLALVAFGKLLDPAGTDLRLGPFRRP